MAGDEDPDPLGNVSEWFVALCILMALVLFLFDGDDKPSLREALEVNHGPR